MSYGYSQSLAYANKKASAKSPGVALGRVCIAKGVSVSAVAKHFGVSRMTVYNWFKGDTLPHLSLADEIRGYIKKHSNK